MALPHPNVTPLTPRVDARLGLLWVERRVCSQRLACVEFRSDHTPEQKRMAVATIHTLLRTLVDLKEYYNSLPGGVPQTAQAAPFERRDVLPYPLNRSANGQGKGDKLARCVIVDGPHGAAQTSTLHSWISWCTASLRRRHMGGRATATDSIARSRTAGRC